MTLPDERVDVALIGGEQQHVDVETGLVFVPVARVSLRRRQAVVLMEVERRHQLLPKSKNVKAPHPHDGTFTITT